MGYVFVSYSRHDEAYVRRLVAHLERAGVTVWLDQGAIEHGARFRRSIRDAIEDCSAFLIVMTRAAEESRWVQDELDWAMRKNKPVYALLLDGEPWFGLAATHYDDVSTGGLPSAALVASLPKGSERPIGGNAPRLARTRPDGDPPAGARQRITVADRALLIGTLGTVLAVVVGLLFLLLRDQNPADTESADPAATDATQATAAADQDQGGETTEATETTVAAESTEPASPSSSLQPDTSDEPLYDPETNLFGSCPPTGPTGELFTFLACSLAQAGDPYAFGVEVSLDDPDPDSFDQSELVQWALYQAGIDMTDGSWLQYREVAFAGSTLSVEQALTTPGALLFRFSSDPLFGDRPDSSHVAISLGDGRTIEARGTAYGVGVFSAEDRNWTHGGAVPEIGLADAETLTGLECGYLRALASGLQPDEAWRASVPLSGDSLPIGPDAPVGDLGCLDGPWPLRSG